MSVISSSLMLATGPYKLDPATTIDVVGATSVSVANSSTLDITLPSNHVSNRLYVVFLCVDGSSGPTFTGWSQWGSRVTGSSSSAGFYVFTYQDVGAPITRRTIDLGVNPTLAACAICVAFSPQSSRSVSNTGSYNTTSATTVNYGSITTSSPATGIILSAGFSFDTSSYLVSAPTGFTNVKNVGKSNGAGVSTSLWVNYRTYDASQSPVTVGPVSQGANSNKYGGRLLTTSIA